MFDDLRFSFSVFTGETTKYYYFSNTHDHIYENKLLKSAEIVLISTFDHFFLKSGDLFEINQRRWFLPTLIRPLTSATQAGHLTKTSPGNNSTPQRGAFLNPALGVFNRTDFLLADTFTSRWGNEESWD